MVVSAKERQTEYQGTEQHVEVIKREKEADEDPESEYYCLKRFYIHTLLSYSFIFLLLTFMSLWEVMKAFINHNFPLCKKNTRNVSREKLFRSSVDVLRFLLKVHYIHGNSSHSAFGKGVLQGLSWDCLNVLQRMGTFF